MDRFVDLFVYGDSGPTAGDPETVFFIMVMSFVVGQITSPHIMCGPD